MHVQKYTKKGLGNLLAHYERKNNETRNYANESIDKTKTERNYNLAPEHEGKTDYQFTMSRCEEIGILKRDDVNYCADWCVTVPSEIKDDEEKCKAFFKASYDFLAQRYGEKNVVSSYVHHDETTPHMHFCFIPEYVYSKDEFDKESGILQTVKKTKVSAKMVLDKKELSSIHKEMQDFLDVELPFKANIITGVTNGDNHTIKELKEKDKLKEYNEQLRQAQKVMLQNVEKLKQYTESMEKKKDDIYKYVSNLYDSSVVPIDELQRKVENLDNRFYDIERTFKGFESVANNNKQITLTLDKNKSNQKDRDEELDFV